MQARARGRMRRKVCRGLGAVAALPARANRVGHLDDSSVVCMRICGVADLPGAKVGAGRDGLKCAQNVVRAPIASWARVFDMDQQLVA